MILLCAFRDAGVYGGADIGLGKLEVGHLHAVVDAIRVEHPMEELSR